MRLVVADTSPLNYLVLIGQVELLPALFEKVFVPQIVGNELRHDEAPESVRRVICAVSVLMAAITDSGWAIAAGLGRAWFMKPARAKLIGRLSGAVLIGGGMWLSLQRRPA